MFKFLVAAAVALGLAAAAWGAAATLTVGWGTAATGSGTVGSCGDVTGTTFLLKGTTVSGEPAIWSGPVTDVTKVTGVNIETVASCVAQNVFVQLTDSGGNALDGVGFCEVTAGGGLGWLEGSGGDNVPGCTVTLSAEVSVAAIAGISVTMN